MFVEILSCKHLVIPGYDEHGQTTNYESCEFESVTLNLNHVEAIKLRKSRAGSSLHPDYFPAIEYNCGGRDYCELFESDKKALNRYNEIRQILATGRKGGSDLNHFGYYSPDFILLPMDASHKNEPFRNYLRLFCNRNINELDKIIEDYNQRILNGNIKEEETISEWLNNFLDKRRKMKEAEQENEVKKVVTLL